MAVWKRLFAVIFARFLRLYLCWCAPWFVACSFSPSGSGAPSFGGVKSAGSFGGPGSSFSFNGLSW